MNVGTLLTRKLGGYFRNRFLHEYGFGFTARSKNGVFIADPRDFVITNSLLKRGTWSYHDVELLSRFVGPDSAVCFVGAHIGTLLVPISKRVRKVVGYEASAHTYELLEMNCKLNDVDNHELRHCAVGDTNGRVSFEYNAMNSGHSRMSTQAGGSRSSTEVDVVVFDEHADNPETSFDLLVIDVEGAECTVLAGMPKTLAKNPTLFIEFSPKYLGEFGRTPADFIELLSPHYPHMYYEADDTLVAFEDHCWEDEVQRLARKPKYLENFLVTKSPVEPAARSCARSSDH